jgi:hypothetical protein
MEPHEQFVQIHQDTAIPKMERVKMDPTAPPSVSLDLSIVSEFFENAINGITYGLQFVLTIIGYGFHYVFGSISSFSYNIVFSITKWWFLSMKSFPIIGGYQGIHQSEICSDLMGTASKNYLDGTGKNSCDEKIFQEVTGRASVVVAVLITTIVCYSVKPLWHYAKYCWYYREIMQQKEDAEKQRLLEEKQNKITAEKRQKTTEANKVVVKTMLQIIGVLKLDYEIGDDQVKAMREILNNIQNEKALEDLQWKEKKKRWRLSMSSCQDRISRMIDNEIPVETDILQIDDHFNEYNE